MPQIIPIKELKNTSDISDKCHSTNEPIFITKNGYGDMVIMSIETYEAIQRLSMYTNLATSSKQMENGELSDARTSLESMREKYEL